MFVPYVLSEVLNHQEGKYVIMSDLENIIQFLSKIKLSNADVLKYNHSSCTTIFSSRRKLMNLTNHYKIDKIIFFHTEFGGIINWFLQEKSKQCEIFYCRVYNSMPFSKAHGIRALKYYLKERLLYGVDMDILVEKPRLLPSLPESFFKKIGALPYSIEIDNNKIKKQISDVVTGAIEKAKVVLLTGATVQHGLVTETEYIAKTNALIEAIKKHNCVAKCHPHFNDVYGKERELTNIPSYIPGNLIIDNFEIFIGNHSTLLVEAALAGKVAISLLDYYEQDSKQVENLKSFLADRLQNRGVIHYPKSTEEILALIKEYL